MIRKACFAIATISCLVSATTSQALTILCLGDSLTEGYGVKHEEAWPTLIEPVLKKNHPDIKIINAGISGATSASGPGRMKWHLKNLAKNPIDAVILALGANDALRGLDLGDAKKNLIATIDMAQQSHIKVILAGMKAPPNLGADYTKKFESMYPDIAKEKHLDLMPFLLKDVAGNPKLNQSDGIHPNAAGHKIVATTVVNYLENNKDLFRDSKNTGTRR